MRTYCKNVDITNPHVIRPWIDLCIAGKTSRSDFARLLRRYGDSYGIAVEITQRIKARRLALAPIRFFNRMDGMSGKMRELGVEEALQICMDYVAVNALMPLFRAKIGHYQCASIPGRGQVYGKKALEKWVNGDPEHSKYYDQGDVRHCYKSMKAEMIERHLRRDVKNETLIWFVMELVHTHINGLSIGSYLSQFLCNYCLSYAYHYASEQLYKVRRGVRVRLCYHVLFFQDDIILLGNDKRNLKMAMRRLDQYMRAELGISLKPTHSVKEVTKEAIDMMGYVVHRGYTTIRARIFIRARRAFLRAAKVLQTGAHLSLRASYRVVSYRGFFVNSNTLEVRVMLHLFEITQAAKQTISYYAKKRRKQNAESVCAV